MSTGPRCAELPLGDVVPRGDARRRASMDKPRSDRPPPCYVRPDPALCPNSSPLIQKCQASKSGSGNTSTVCPSSNDMRRVASALATAAVTTALKREASSFIPDGFHPARYGRNSTAAPSGFSKDRTVKSRSIVNSSERPSAKLIRIAPFRRIPVTSVPTNSSKMTPPSSVSILMTPACLIQSSRSNNPNCTLISLQGVRLATFGRHRPGLPPPPAPHPPRVPAPRGAGAVAVGAASDPRGHQEAEQEGAPDPGPATPRGRPARFHHDE